MAFLGIFRSLIKSTPKMIFFEGESVSTDDNQPISLKLVLTPLANVSTSSHAHAYKSHFFQQSL